MQSLVSKIVKMMDSERPERRYAAVMVLGELGSKDAPVVDRLLGCLAEDDRMLQLHTLDALAAIRPRKIASHVAPLLDSRDEELRLRAAALLAGQGGRAAAEIARELDHGSPTRRREMVKILAQHHDTRTLKRLLELLPDADVGEVVLVALRRELDRMSDKAQAELKAGLLERIKKVGAAADMQGTAHALRLLGHVRDAKLVTALLPFVGKKHPIPVRLAAIAALRRPLEAARALARPTATLLEQTTDSDPSVARAAVETLRPLTLPAEAVPKLAKLLASPHAETRAFAVGALARSGSAKATDLVVNCLSADDAALREAATRALRGGADAATAGLLEQLRNNLSDAGITERLVRLLLPQAAQLKPAARKDLVQIAVAATEAASPAATPLLRLVRATDPEGYASLLTERAMKHRRAKRAGQALALFNQLDDSDLLSDDARYAALLCGLQTTSSKKDLARASRTTNPVLRHAVALLNDGFPLAKRLAKEKGLTTDDLFFVGFNFAESREDDEQELGASLLAHLASKSPRSKLGRSAKNKLKLIGWEG